MGASKTPLIAAILCGGGGTRFWPLSHKARPKQFLKLFSDRTLLTETLDRISPSVAPGSTLLVGTDEQRAQLTPYTKNGPEMLLEPVGRNTAACCALVARLLEARKTPLDTVIATFPADHRIEDQKVFQTRLEEGALLAYQSKSLVTFGITPTSPHTGYGYIEADRGARKGRAFGVRRFREKPDLATAESFLQSGDFFWNSGIFLWRVDAILEALEEHWPKGLAAFRTWEPGQPLAPVYASLPADPIDVAVLEKAKNVVVVPAAMGWSDVGSWGALYELLAPNADANGNVTVRGGGMALEASGNLSYSERGDRVVFFGVEDLVVVESNGTILIAPRSRDQEIKKIAESLPTST